MYFTYVIVFLMPCKNICSSGKAILRSAHYTSKYMHKHIDKDNFYNKRVSKKILIFLCLKENENLYIVYED